MRSVIVFFGGSGYSGLELLRILAGHPAVKVEGASSDKNKNDKISEHVPEWFGPETFIGHDELKKRVQPGQIAFLATPNQTSHDLAPELLDRGATVIDLSGAFRLQKKEDYSSWYELSHQRQDLLDEAVYGLPELFLAKYPKAPRLIANPGCYSTAAILALAPLIPMITSTLIIDGKSGATGAGRKLADDLLFSEVAETVRPYRLGNHQHTPEIERFLGHTALFTPHLLSIRRGLLVSAYASVREGVTQGQIDAAYASTYANAPFVRVLTDRAPHPGMVVHTNFCDVRAVFDPRTQTVMAFGALDNLVKGAAGQAVQNMNIILGLDQRIGLLAGAK